MPRFALAACAILVACGGPVKDPLVGIDASPDAADAIAPLDGGPDADPTLGGPCTDDGQCDDKVACTHDACDLTLLRCRNVPDDTLCDDGAYCNGKEVCTKTGCGAGPVVACSTATACDIDACDETQKTCSHTLRDVDGDGDGDDHCGGGHDCDDANPAVSSLHSEICGNGVDDNCNGTIDEQPCVVAQNATCNTALPVTAPGTYGLSTVGAPKAYGASCSVTNPNAAHDVLAAVTVPSWAKVDLDVWAEGSSGETAEPASRSSPVPDAHTRYVSTPHTRADSPHRSSAIASTAARSRGSCCTRRRSRSSIHARERA